jgi:hypothetical protein
MIAGLNSDIINEIFKDGVSTTAALVCMGLYIRQLVRERGQDKAGPIQTRLEDQQYSTIIASLNEIKENQKIIIDHIGALISSEAISLNMKESLSEDSHEIKNIGNILLQDLRALSANQLNLMTGFQRVIEQLIDALKHS